MSCEQNIIKDEAGCTVFLTLENNGIDLIPVYVSVHRKKKSISLYQDDESKDLIQEFIGMGGTSKDVWMSEFKHIGFSRDMVDQLLEIVEYTRLAK